MKTLLIHPPASLPRRNIRNCSPPLGLAWLGATLRRRGRAVELLDCQIEGFASVTPLPRERQRFGLAAAEIAERLRRAAPDVIGVSCTFSQMHETAKEVLRLAKAVCPQATTIAGGVHATQFPEDLLAEPATDLLARGQAEETLPELLAALEAGRDPAAIAGVSVRGAGGAGPRISPETAFVENLDAVPFPAWDLLPLEDYLRLNRPHGGQARRRRVMPLMTSRGCPNACAYCAAGALWRRRIAFRSPQNVVDEIRWLMDRWRIDEVHFEDDNLLADRGRALEMFGRMATQTPGVAWNVPNGISVAGLDDELIAAMARSGCYEVALAVESGVSRVLTEVLGKRDYLPRLRDIVRSCKAHGLFVLGFFIIGWPGETRAEAEATMRAPFDYGFMDANMGAWVPIPGTKLYDIGVSTGMIDAKDVDFDRIHMTALIPRRNGVPLDVLWKLIARTNLRLKLRLLLRRPRLFFRRFVRPFLQDPAFGWWYVRQQLLGQSLADADKPT